MAPKIPDNIRDELNRHPGKPLEIEDAATHKVYVIVPKDDFVKMVDDELRRQLQIGFDQADAGEVAEWDVDEILAEAHRPGRCARQTVV